MKTKAPFPLPAIHGHFGRGTNATSMSVKDITLYYSYKTLVAFDSPKTGLVCRKNDWGVTTGGHLNAIQPNHKARVDLATFEAKWAEATT